MQIRVFIDKSGVEKIASRRMQDLYHWNYGVRDCNPDSPDQLPEGCVWISEPITISLPSCEQCLPTAVKNLEAEKAEVYATAAKEAAVINDKLQNLLAIGHSPVRVVTADDDIPF